MQSQTIQICVTDEDIRKGKRKLGSSCPIALAAKRVFPYLIDLHVGEQTLYYDGLLGKSSRTIKLPDEAIDFVKEFDAPFRSEKLEPFCFDILDPSFVV